MKREIKFVVNDKNYGFCAISTVDKPKEGRGAHNFKGYEISGGYVLRKVEGHPNANGRGYYLEHRLIVEKNIKRLLLKDEVVHHIDGNRKNNEISNLKVITQSEHAGIEMTGKRNPNGTLVAKEPIFDQIKFRLHATDRGTTRIYTLSQLIGTTFRRGKFQFRGRWTGLKDKNGKEIYEGDIVKLRESPTVYPKQDYKFEQIDVVSLVEWDKEGADFQMTETISHGKEPIIRGFTGKQTIEIIGNIYQNPELLK